MPWYYIFWLWSVFQPQPHYQPPPPPVYWQQTMPVQQTPVSQAPTFNPAQWPPGYIPNPNQLGLTQSGCRVLQPGLSVCG